MSIEKNKGSITFIDYKGNSYTNNSYKNVFSSGGGNDEVLKGLLEGTLTEFVIPEGITKIKDNLFEKNSNLTNVSIPNSVTSIGISAFSGCTSLTSIEIPNSVTSIGMYAFVGCKSLTNINIPNSVTSIETLTFSGCKSLTNINISNSVTSIKYGAFSDCTSLTYLEIPSSVTSIESSALTIGSSRVKGTIRFLGITPPTITTSTFNTSLLEKIEVPMTGLEAYKSETNWSIFADYIVGYE